MKIEYISVRESAIEYHLYILPGIAYSNDFSQKGIYIYWLKWSVRLYW